MTNHAKFLRNVQNRKDAIVNILEMQKKLAARIEELGAEIPAIAAGIYRQHAEPEENAKVELTEANARMATLEAEHQSTFSAHIYAEGKLIEDQEKLARHEEKLAVKAASRTREKLQTKINAFMNGSSQKLFDDLSEIAQMYGKYHTEVYDGGGVPDQWREVAGVPIGQKVMAILALATAGKTHALNGRIRYSQIEFKSLRHSTMARIRDELDREE